MAGGTAFAAAGTLQPGKASERVLGWDVLRGLCALAVALYHLLYWQDLRALQASPLELVVVQAHQPALAGGGRCLLQRHLLRPLPELEPLHPQRDGPAAHHGRSAPSGNSG